MNVVFDDQIFAIQRYGGVSRYFVELAKNLPSASHGNIEPEVIAPFYKNEYLKLYQEQLRIRGVFIPNVMRDGPIIRFANSLLSPLILKRSRPDLIHETYYSSKKNGHDQVKRIVTVYDMIHELFHEGFSVKDNTRELKKLAISRADHVICISENTRKDLIQILGIDPEKTSVAHLGFSLSADTQKEVRSNQKPFLLYVGSRHTYKNFTRFIKSYARSAKLSSSFDVIAFGGGSFTNAELSLFNELKLPAACVKQVGGSDELLAYYYRNAALFVYPSLYEGFGIPPLEAMSYGCPVACSNTSSIPEVVGNAAFKFDPFLIDSISYSLECALFDTESRDAVISKGFSRIKKFSWEKCAKETSIIYEKVMQ